MHFPGTVKLVSSSQDEDEAVELLDRESLIGFDSESKVRGLNEPRSPPCLVQLSSANNCFIWRLSSPEVPTALKYILENKSLVKVSQGAIGEVTSLAYNFDKLKPSGFLCIYNIASSLRCHPRSLQGLVGIFLKRYLDKSLCVSDWTAPVLSDDQLNYAATDAYSSLQVLHAMRSAFRVDVLPQEILVDSVNLGVHAKSPVFKVS